MAGRCGLRTSLAIGLAATGPAFSAQGGAVSDGTATPAEQAIAIAFILSLPVTLLLIGLSRMR
ncbi:hypothetical protein [Methylobacterium haplocladii]|uniref:Uncharacterized protein n=1 Tax=Methylobacterium haplocladii TaxID=1176176 RepID=A0A512IJQ3_9HYPH|nr:hypothetical protein [Methylobacterium haplocladii]GEO97919.1 hypothetical protein MHA02_03070 [Methylobacterium haplocladii]GJD84845.1 hypothetical protein HPGCJGGD_2728 [Methylobacterium haplocladii]GLS58684.1 hypothetical protein GCM10007887_13480 [Methylobacterium haplocladii]